MRHAQHDFTRSGDRRMMDDLGPYIDLQRDSRELRPQLLASGGAD